MTDPDQDDLARQRLALEAERQRQRGITEWKIRTLRWNLARLGLTEDDLDHS
jgi:hypothetical protein